MQGLLSDVFRAVYISHVPAYCVLVGNNSAIPVCNPTMKFTTLGSAFLAFTEAAAAQKIATTTRKTTYDYIVAGGGTAGIVAAERLATSGRSVLLLERGGASFYSTGNTKTISWNDTVTMYDVPGMSDYLGIDPDLQYCKDLAIAGGCLLGGSTMLNALMFVRPRAADFASWPEEWHWENGISQAAEEFYERQPGTILASEDGKRYDDGAFGIMSKFLERNGWSEGDALNDPESKELMYSHPPWSVSLLLNHGRGVDGLTHRPLDCPRPP